MLVTLGASLGKLLRQLTEDGGAVILDHWFGCDSTGIDGLQKHGPSLDEEAIFRLGRGLERVQSFNLGRYGVVEVVERYEAYGRLPGRLANGAGDHLLEVFIIERPCVEVSLDGRGRGEGATCIEMHRG